GRQNFFHGRFTHYAWLSHSYPRYPKTTTGWCGAFIRITTTLEYHKREKNHRESNECGHAQFCYLMFATRKVRRDFAAETSHETEVEEVPAALLGQLR
ncbi:hypothetical protein, partial [Rhizobium leguminosarum]|uniref:hypothetical protein n=1 Tax=Rhizobium leguminosarum TaxID=384 RepID=UPI003F9DF1C2